MDYCTSPARSYHHHRPTDTATVSPEVAVHKALLLVQSDCLDSKFQGACEIRRLTKTSQRCRRQLSESIPHLVSMLHRPHSPESHLEAALLALLNLAVKDEK